MVPLFVLCTLKPLARNPRGVEIRELFTTPPGEERHYFRAARSVEPVLHGARSHGPRDRSVHPRNDARARHASARGVGARRLNGEGGLGAIFPAMVNALEY